MSKFRFGAQRKLQNWVAERIFKNRLATHFPLSSCFIRLKQLAHSQISSKLILLFLLVVYASIFVEKMEDLL